MSAAATPSTPPSILTSTQPPTAAPATPPPSATPPTPTPPPVQPQAGSPGAAPSEVTVDGRTYKIADLISQAERGAKLEQTTLALLQSGNERETDARLGALMTLLNVPPDVQDQILTPSELQPVPDSTGRPKPPSPEEERLVSLQAQAQTAAVDAAEAKVVLLDQMMQRLLPSVLEAHAKPVLDAITRLTSADHATKVARPQIEGEIIERAFQILDAKLSSLPASQRRLDYRWVPQALEAATIEAAKRASVFYGDPNAVGKAPTVETPLDALLRKPPVPPPVYGKADGSKPLEYIKDAIARADAEADRVTSGRTSVL